MSRRGYAIEQRLRLIDFLLAQYGYVNRQALMDYFGISLPQASNDFAAYIEAAPNNMSYDNGRRCYVAGANFKRLYL